MRYHLFHSQFAILRGILSGYLFRLIEHEIEKIINQESIQLDDYIPPRTQIFTVKIYSILIEFAFNSSLLFCV